MPAIQDCLLAGTFKPTVALKGTTTKNGLLGCVHLQGRLQRTPFTRVRHTVSLLAEAGLQIPHLSSEQSPGEQRHTVTAPLSHPWVQVEPQVQPEIPLQRYKDPFLLGCFVFYLRKQPAQGSFGSPGQVTEQQETVPWQKTIRSCPVSCTGK